MGPFQMFLILTATWCGGVLTKEPDLNTETIALEQYGVVLKPGKLMSNADVPKRDERLKGCVEQAAVGPRGSGGTLNMRYSAGETD